jgi:DNA-binding NarL/FixJ family response regulator
MKRILWIEDEAKVELIQFKKPLVRAGNLVDIASDATKAIQLLREKEYDALIFDLIIPQGPNFKTDEFYVGLGLLKEVLDGKIDGVAKYKPSKVMVFSVVNDPKVHKKIKRDLGVETILIKSLNRLTDLKDRVDKLLKAK